MNTPPGMGSISNEDIRKFSEGLDACMQRQPGGGVAVDTSALRALIRRRPEVAARYVELTCMAAMSNPSLVQAAMLVATACQAEVGDSSLLEKVMETAKATGGEKWLKRMKPRTSKAPPIDERPERLEAIRWWQSNNRPDGNCDNCNRRVLRGEGFVIQGPAVMIGERRVDIGKELVCEDCYRELG